jgi:hypothetical protein
VGFLSFLLGIILCQEKRRKEAGKEGLQCPSSAFDSAGMGTKDRILMIDTLTVGRGGKNMFMVESGGWKVEGNYDSVGSSAARKTDQWDPSIGCHFLCIPTSYQQQKTLTHRPLLPYQRGLGTGARARLSCESNPC